MILTCNSILLIALLTTHQVVSISQPYVIGDNLFFGIPLIPNSSPLTPNS
jgi:hypothetical protein